MVDSYSRVRSIKLGRGGGGGGEEPFGFSVRGGHEHGTGLFVSFVDPRSIAWRTGLKVGDQILRVNGFPVSAAVHHECLSLMRLRPSLHLKVRSVGMLPVKDKSGDPLTWKLVEEQPTLDDHHLPGQLQQGQGHRGHSRLSDTSSQSPHPDSSSTSPHPHPTEAKVFIDMTGRDGLGCCICKGPAERPGIFVQSTKTAGVAREAGLRPGDQLLSCNGHSFLHVPFAEAVLHLKSSAQLRLRVLKGAACDLFPGESSSGYNSSASSLNGDPQGQGQNHHRSGQGQSRDRDRDPDRLNRVVEELSGSGGGSGGSGSGMMILDSGMEWDEVERVWRSAERETIVIEVKGMDSSSAPGGGGGGAPNQNHHHTHSDQERLRLAEERRELEVTQARLVAEALRLEEEKRKWEQEKRSRGQQGQGQGQGQQTQGSTSNGGGESGGLAGALSQEILKRSEREKQIMGGGMIDTDELDGGQHGQEFANNNSNNLLPKPGTVEAKRSLFNTQIDLEKRQQHEQLIEEFKRAHRKMFAHNVNNNATIEEEPCPDSTPSDSPSELALARRRVQKERDHERQMVAQRVAGIVRLRQLRIERQAQESEETEREIIRKGGTLGTTLPSKSPPPPPPPPMPPKGPAPSIPAPALLLSQSQPKRVLIIEEGGNVAAAVGRNNNNNSASASHTKGKAPPPPAPTGPTRSRPASPSPDYSNSPSPLPTRAASASAKMKGGGGVGVDMTSLESYRLKDPPPRGPKKPPPVYFPHGNNRMMMQQMPILGGSNNTTSTPYGNKKNGFVEGNNAKNVEASSGLLRGGIKTISFMEKY